MAKSIQATVDRYRSGTQGADQAYKDGIANTQVDVMQRAIQGAGAAVRNYTQALTSGRWAAAINASGGTANWKAMAQAKSANYGTGVAAGLPKFQTAMGKLLPAIEGIVASLPARVPGNPQANLARVSGLVLGLHARKGEFKG